MDNLNAISANVEALPLEDLVTTGTRVLGTADAFLASQGVQDVPPKLDAALEELRAILAELQRRAARPQNVNSTLASASRAADAVTAAADDLPALVARFNAVADAADAALASVGPNSRVNRDTLLLLQEVRDAARSVNQLVARAGTAPQLGPLREMSMRATLPCLLAASLALAACGGNPDYYLLPPPQPAARAAPRRSAASPSPTSACPPTPARSRSPR